MPMGHTRVLTNSVSLEGAILGRDAINVHGPITALGRDILIHGIPSNTLNIVRMLSDLVDTFP